MACANQCGPSSELTNELELAAVGLDETYFLGLFPSIQTADWGTVISLPQLSVNSRIPLRSATGFSWVSQTRRESEINVMWYVVVV